MALLRVIQPFAVPTSDGGMRVLRVDALVDENDPAVKGRPAEWFEPVEVTAERNRSTVIEQATASPGEKRTTRK